MIDRERYEKDFFALKENNPVFKDKTYKIEETRRKEFSVYARCARIVNGERTHTITLTDKKVKYKSSGSKDDKFLSFDTLDEAVLFYKKITNQFVTRNKEKIDAI